MDFETKFCRARKADNARLCALRGGLTQRGGILQRNTPEGVFGGRRMAEIMMEGGKSNGLN
jgi:hypothetical protein